MKATSLEYHGLNYALGYFNEHLFQNKLPDVLLTMQRKASALGYYCAGLFSSRQGEGDIAEIALNPDEFANRSDEEIMSTLVHEMVHHWQHNYGEPGRGRYHNKEFAAKMEEVGLQCTSNGRPDGKRTGQNMSHLIIPDGKFKKVFEDLVQTNEFKIRWESKVSLPDLNTKLDTSKVKFTCKCHKNIWANVFTVAVCLTCQTIFKWADEERIKQWIKTQISNPKTMESFTDYEKSIEIAIYKLEMIKELQNKLFL